ncbi:MAG: prolyl oligopeptidase family serine peptidase [Streptosporangiaceae bacterium]
MTDSRGPDSRNGGAPYPDAERSDVADTIHGRIVADPYRWLEDPGSAAAKEWLAAQDALYAGQRDRLPGRDRLAARLTELLDTGAVSPPVWRGNRRFCTRREAGQEHAVLYTATPGGGERALIDPAALDPAGITTLDAWRPDREGRLLAYQLSEGGSEESSLRVMDVETGADVDEPISRTRYSPVAWLPGGTSFYYVRRLAPGDVPPGEDQYHRRVYLHEIGQPAGQDVLIFGAGRDKTEFYSVAVSIDGRWLAIGASKGTAPRNDLWLADLSGTGPARPQLRVVQEDVDAQADARVGRDGRLYILTDRDAPRGRLAVADPARPADWTDLIGPDSEAVLTSYAILDGAELARPVLLAAWSRHAISEVTVHDLATGRRLAAVPMPGLGSVSGFTEHPEGGHEAWFAYTDNVTPVTIYRYDAAEQSASVWERPPGTAEVSGITAEQVEYRSKDGTTVRMLIVSGARPGSAGHAAGSGTTGRGTTGSGTTGSGTTGSGTGRSGPDEAADRTPRPAILYAYGGFNISLTPAYSAQILAWVEAGGRYAIAGLRGGSEEGEEWHRAGMRDRKQNVFDDFHAAAGALIAGGWTTPGQLSVAGGSNGGLLVGAAITQRPDLYAAAVCSAPLLDMVRYERFGLGELWSDEYGTAADPGELGWLLSYSPYHHVRDGVRYPAVLFTIFDSDTRVDPLHARKMCAALQHATSAPFAERPVLLRRESDVGHGARAVSRSVALSAETLAFAAAQTGLRL